MLADGVSKNYKTLYDEYGVDPRSLGWASSDRQQQRFSILLQGKLGKVSSVLDVGSGMGDLVPHLRFSKAGLLRTTSYLGVEPIAEFIDVARLRYPELHWHEGDILDMPVLPKYDLVVASGTFGWLDSASTFQLLDLMWRKTNVVMAFNFSTNTTSLRPKYIIDYADSEADGGWAMRNDYLSGDDYTVHMYKGDRG